MSRLITFGCSHTYGHGLEDCILHDNMPGPVASKFSWPNHLANSMGLEVVNMSRPGASNLEILYRILDFEFHPSDTVVILWTEIARDLIWLEKPLYPGGQIFRPVGSWMTVEHDNVDAEAWLSLHNDVDFTIRSWFCVNHAELYFEKMGIKNHSFFVNSAIMYQHLPKFIRTKNAKDFYAWDILFHLHDRALDGGHPGPEAHKQFANAVFNIIND